MRQRSFPSIAFILLSTLARVLASSRFLVEDPELASALIASSLPEANHSRLNNRPLIGILTQRDDPARGKDSYIASSYVKFVESAGARAVPIFCDMPREEVERRWVVVRCCGRGTAECALHTLRSNVIMHYGFWHPIGQGANSSMSRNGLCDDPCPPRGQHVPLRALSDVPCPPRDQHVP